MVHDNALYCTCFSALHTKTDNVLNISCMYNNAYKYAYNLSNYLDIGMIMSTHIHIKYRLIT